jgi:photosystem II stability/assembly factor-like uncharacterized protein
MTDNDLERELRSHYRSLDDAPSGRTAALVERALDRAPSRRWSLGSLAGRRSLGLAALVGAVALLSVAALPILQGTSTGPGANSMSSATATNLPVTLVRPSSAVVDSDTLARIAAAQVDAAGVAPDGTLWAKRDGSLFLSQDHGSTWQARQLPAVANDADCSVSVIDATNAWACEGEYRTADGGTTWQATKQPVIPDSSYDAESFLDARVGFVIRSDAKGNSSVLRTTDGGATWKVAHPTVALHDAIVAVDANTLWTGAGLDLAAGPRPLLRVSRDAGATWSTVNLPGVGDTSSADVYVLSDPAGGIAFVSTTEGYVAVSDYTRFPITTRIFRTTDGGRSWSQAFTVPENVVFAPAPLDAAQWYQAGMQQLSISFCIEVTTAGGTGVGITVVEDTWPAGVPIKWSATADGQNGASPSISATSGKPSLLVTPDGGKSWREADFTAR